MTSLPKDSSVCQPKTEDGKNIILPHKELVLSNHLAATLKLDKGDTLLVEVVDMRDGITLNIQVVDIVAHYIGIVAYMDYDVMQESS
ncbi:hypothetical protein ACFRAM_28700 [Paenibacillus sp. NPDC056722]|uniref:hypothetical protein n=1 Tax=Paenibacillus sp. NPDC056722 TaxID=3345924 RepID=UPI00368329CB